MSTLSKSERDGLEDIFLSIHSNQNKYQKIKNISTLIISKKNNFSIPKLLKQAKDGLKETKITHFMTFFDKKKKNLSK
ncbi:MAG: hypothetical protein J7J96_05665 [Sulfurimonas sp.]|nr:hypothetical protein [Sulfurimonas sp.]